MKMWEEVEMWCCDGVGSWSVMSVIEMEWSSAVMKIDDLEDMKVYYCEFIRLGDFSDVV